MDLRRAAVSLRKAAAEKGIDVKVRAGGPGQLQIFRDGIKLFDYKEAGDLPETGQLLRLIGT
jgi:predicted Rdx family selenoprotein